MPLRSQKQVMVHLDRMSARQMKRASRAYVDNTIAPLLAAIRNAGTGREALLQLGTGLLQRMNSQALEVAVADAGVQCGMIGRASALPKAKKSKESIGSPERKTNATS